jgi:hypothetical protein
VDSTLKNNRRKQTLERKQKKKKKKNQKKKKTKKMMRNRLEKATLRGGFATMNSEAGALVATNDLDEEGRADCCVEADGSAGSTTSVEGVSDDNVVVSHFGVGRTDRVRAAVVSTAAAAVARLGALADAAAVNGAEHAAMEEQPDRLQQRRRQEPAPEPQRAKLEVRLAPFDGAWNGKFEDVHMWLREFQYELDIHQWPDRARAMRSFLIGAAREFVINLDADVKNDYDALVASLRQRFAPVNYNEMVYKQINTVQPAAGEPPSQVFGRMQLLNARLSDEWRMTDQALFYRILLNLVSGEHRALIETAGDIRACMTVADRVHVYTSVWRSAGASSIELSGADNAAGVSVAPVVAIQEPVVGVRIQNNCADVSAIWAGAGSDRSNAGVARRRGGKRVGVAVCFRCNAPGHKRFQCARVQARSVAASLRDVVSNRPVGGSVLAAEEALRGAAVGANVVSRFNQVEDCWRRATDLQSRGTVGGATAVGNDVQAVRSACVGMGNVWSGAHPFVNASVDESVVSSRVGGSSSFRAAELQDHGCGGARSLVDYAALRQDWARVGVEA